MWKWLWIGALTLGTATAADRSALQGTWNLDPAHSQGSDEKLKAETVSITQKPRSIHIIEDVTDSDGKQTRVEIDCNTVGKECKANDAQLTLYYNGPMLVLIETRHGGDNVIKKRWKASDDGKTLSLEVMHIVPAGTAETYSFSRQANATMSQ